jgi:hypothetical protein
MSRSNGVAEEAVKEMKKIIRANISPIGVLNRPSTVAGLMMFRNTPRSPTDLSPAQLIFGQDIRDSLPITRASLTPEHRFAVEERLHTVRKEKTNGKKEMELLQQGQKVFVQNPSSKRWTSTATIVKFGANNREYIIRNDDTGKEYRRNRRFLKPQRVTPVTPPRQPVPAPELRPLTEVKQVPSEPSVPRVIPAGPEMAINNRPQRQKKPIVRFQAGHNKYYEPAQIIED